MRARWLAMTLLATGCDVAIELRSREDGGRAESGSDVLERDVLERDAIDDGGVSQRDAAIDVRPACANDVDCGPLSRCVAGVCEPRCAPSAEACNGVDDDCDGAIDESDPMSAQLCPTGQACSGGACRATGGCPAGTTPCAGVCANLASDARNCGACGAACGAGQRCAMGVCAP